MQPLSPEHIPLNSPFHLENTSGYAHWREQKLANYPDKLEQIVIPIANPQKLTTEEEQKIRDCCRRANMAIYQVAAQFSHKEDFRHLGQQLGLQTLDHNPYADDDAITSLTVADKPPRQGYIPYSDKPIAWHTDGYYNPINRQIRGLLLHCVNPAFKGGENALFDQEILYILLRDQNPAWINALMHPQVMTIPANETDAQVTRSAQSGPVFLVYPDGQLHLRYTARKRNIIWRQDSLTQEAVQAIQTLLQQPSPYQFQAKLQAAQGLISNNVLHTRTGFEDRGTPRLLYRARYYERILC